MDRGAVLAVLCLLSVAIVALSASWLYTKKVDRKNRRKIPDVDLSAGVYSRAIMFISVRMLALAAALAVGCAPSLSLVCQLACRVAATVSSGTAGDEICHVRERGDTGQSALCRTRPQCDPARLTFEPAASDDTKRLVEAVPVGDSVPLAAHAHTQLRLRETLSSRADDLPPPGPPQSVNVLRI